MEQVWRKHGAVSRAELRREQLDPELFWRAPQPERGRRESAAGADVSEHAGGAAGAQV